MNNHFNEVAKRLDQLGRRHELSKTFNDLLTMSICSFHRTNLQSRLQVKDQENEERYMGVISKYTKVELETLSETLAHLLLNAKENPYSDILGEYFMENITRGHNGQFFTPDPICEMIAMMQGDQGTTEGKRILDPACGSGRMALQFAKLNPNNFFYGADNSDTCAKMSTLNFFINGLRGEISWMNSLTMEWYGGWHINIMGLGILPIEQDQSVIWSMPSKQKEAVFSSTPENKPENGTLGIQLTLF